MRYIIIFSLFILSSCSFNKEAKIKELANNFCSCHKGVFVILEDFGHTYTIACNDGSTLTNVYNIVDVTYKCN